MIPSYNFRNGYSRLGIDKRPPNKRGNWQLDGAVYDSDIKKNWLVKLPRGRQEIDNIILKTGE